MHSNFLYVPFKKYHLFTSIDNCRRANTTHGTAAQHGSNEVTNLIDTRVFSFIILIQKMGTTDGDIIIHYVCRYIFHTTIITHNQNESDK